MYWVIKCWSIFIATTVLFWNPSAGMKKKIIQQQATPIVLAVSMNNKKCAVDFSTLHCTCRYQCMKKKDHFN